MNLADLIEKEKAKQKNTVPSSDSKNTENNNTNQSVNPNSGSKKINGIDKEKVNFKVQIGVFNPNESDALINKIRKIENVEEENTTDGLVRFTTGEFKAFNQAYDYKRKLINQGIDADTTFIIVIGEYDGKTITADEAKELLKD